MSELTAEQVREAIFNGSTYASYDGVKYYANGINMQAIADELNAKLNTRADYHGYEQAAIEAWKNIKTWNTRAERTCKNNDTDNDEFFQCSECGKSSVTEFLRGGYGVPRYCPSCGARVIKSDQDL